MAHGRNVAPDLVLGALAAALVAASLRYGATTVVLVIASLGLAAACLWSCRVLLGRRPAWIFAAAGAGLGWLAEQAGSTMGWFFGSYTYTDVLGPRLGAVPLVIPLMWFSLCHIGLVLASLLLWRQPVAPPGGWRTGALVALMTAMVVTAFDLGADPYFVYVLKAWIMAKKDGGWFGETLRGFDGWMLVSFTITAVFLAAARPRLAADPAARATRMAVLVPILLYGSLMVFQIVMTEPAAVRVVALYAMGIPLIATAAAWSQWRPAATAETAP